MCRKCAESGLQMRINSSCRPSLEVTDELGEIDPLINENSREPRGELLLKAHLEQTLDLRLELFLDPPFFFLLRLLSPLSSVLVAGSCFLLASFSLLFVVSCFLLPAPSFLMSTSFILGTFALGMSAGTHAI